MRNELSILIPSFNDLCIDQVTELSLQAEQISGLVYEIIIVDDCSTDKSFIEQNSALSSLPNCRYIMNDVNLGRAGIRNEMAELARYKDLLYLDSGIEIVDADFLRNYINTDEGYVVCGGVFPYAPEGDASSCLRYLYEYSSIPKHTAKVRSEAPYKSFRTTNFLIPKIIMQKVKIDNRFKTFGYEDVDFGRRLCYKNIPIKHIDNPVGYRKYETNKRYMEKVETSMHTLYLFREQLADYSPLLMLANKLKPAFPLLRFVHKCLKPIVRRNLIGRRPSLFLLKLYKLGYFVSLYE